MRTTPREIKITKNVNPNAAGSVICEFGLTKIYITASIEEEVPPFLKGKKQGWVTAEYAMLPGSTQSRVRRERKGASGRSTEIQRLIGRSLRCAIDLKKLGERTITIDCDVLVADGGTRTAAISGGYVALALACNHLIRVGLLKESPIIHQVAALSVGISKDHEILADLNYIEDSSCETDMNIVMTGNGSFVEIQGTAEGVPFTSPQLSDLLSCAEQALKVVFEKQNETING